MGNIRILPENVINKIAAGEVVERPASVIKELIENSLDAGAQSITIVAKHGGKALIRVTDDGEGMSPDDAHTALKRHATSKIKSEEDIFHIASFGFRGEALPSIASVSRLMLLTREKGVRAGTELHVAGGVIESAKEAGSAFGTTVEVRDLFFNTPARKKFFRSDGGEYLAVLDTINTFALGNPDVHFQLMHNEKKALDYPACSTLLKRINQLYGDEVANDLIPVKAETSDINIAGFISGASLSRVNRSGQYFFVNRRPVKSPALSFAVQQGFSEILPPKRHGLAFLFLDIALPRVDVNVHPNKKEVRIAQERDVQKLMIDSLRRALHSRQPFPSTHPSILPTKHSLCRGVEPGRRTETVRYHVPFSSAPLLREPTVEFERGEKFFEPVPPSSRQGLPVLEGENGSFPGVIGQYQATYVLAEYQGNLIVIDQHAAHERIVYEKLLIQLRLGKRASQRELVPATFSLDYHEQEVLEMCLSELEKLGFGINNLGRNTYSIDAIPALFASESPKELIFDVIHQMMEWQQSRAVEDKHKAVAAAVACKRKTVKAGVRLTREAMNHLVSDLFKAEQPFQCPHGRPTFVVFSLDELARRFRRR